MVILAEPLVQQPEPKNEADCSHDDGDFDYDDYNDLYCDFDYKGDYNGNIFFYNGDDT